MRSETTNSSLYAPQPRLKEILSKESYLATNTVDANLTLGKNSSRSLSLLIILRKQNIKMLPLTSYSRKNPHVLDDDDDGDDDDDDDDVIADGGFFVAFNAAKLYHYWMVLLFSFSFASKYAFATLKYEFGRRAVLMETKVAREVKNMEYVIVVIGHVTPSFLMTRSHLQLSWLTSRPLAEWFRLARDLQSERFREAVPPANDSKMASKHKDLN
ncbi:hypothetical protein EVAR_64907_1 [Eumeta japonica]|uniref:Uncharacterized protein n=1 Tax=Eumeta variegata TaxID=151549 RepID=A0A4C2A1Z7_EUMVA|nr:hypothetical protein EVAR_64907_1 [Eumeta japonica]